MESDYRLESYLSAIESFEYLESLFKKENVNGSEIQQEMQKCYEKIEALIFQGSTNSPYLVDLFQLKQLMEELIRTMHKKNTNPTIIPFKTTVVDTKKLNDNSLIESTIEIPKVASLKEVAGLWEVKKLLKSLVILPRNQPQLFNDRKACNSVLIFGPPGTGKTHLVHALASEAKATLHCISFSNMLSSYVGQTEKNVRTVFEYVRKTENFCILFIDEVDGFFKMRHNSEQDHTRRMKVELLCQMSKIEDDRNLFLICATNCPWDLDSAFLRRFQRRVYIPMPNIAERRELMQLFMRNTGLDVHSEHWCQLIEKTEGFSGSDLSSLIESALNVPITELEDTKIWKIVEGFYEPVAGLKDFGLEDFTCCELSDLPFGMVRARQVHIGDLFKALDSVSMSVSHSDVVKYEQFVGK